MQYAIGKIKIAIGNMQLAIDKLTNQKLNQKISKSPNQKISKSKNL